MSFLLFWFHSCFIFINLIFYFSTLLCYVIVAFMIFYVSYSLVVCSQLFLDIFKRPPYTLTVRSLVGLLKPRFSEEGSNRRRFENEIYGQFMKYIRLVASK